MPFARVSAAIVAGFLISAAASAGGIDDLRSALARLPGDAPVAAVLAIETWNRVGADETAEERSGNIEVAVSDAGDGLQLQFGPDVLARTDAEQRAVDAGKDAPPAATPTLNAMRALDAVDVHAQLSAAPTLLRQITEAEFKGEQSDTWSGQPARRLTFAFGKDGLRARERRFISKFSRTLEVWIGNDGAPLASTLRQHGSGSAFLVVSFENELVEDVVYQTAGDRLLVVRKETRNSGSGAGEKNESRVTRTLRLRS